MILLAGSKDGRTGKQDTGSWVALIGCFPALNVSIYLYTIHPCRNIIGKQHFFGNPLKITPVFWPFSSTSGTGGGWHVSPANTNLGHNTPDLFVSWQACSKLLYPKRLFSSTTSWNWCSSSLASPPSPKILSISSSCALSQLIPAIPLAFRFPVRYPFRLPSSSSSSS